MRRFLRPPVSAHEIATALRASVPLNAPHSTSPSGGEGLHLLAWLCEGLSHVNTATWQARPLHRRTAVLRGVRRYWTAFDHAMRPGMSYGVHPKSNLAGFPQRFVLRSPNEQPDAAGHSGGSFDRRRRPNQPDDPRSASPCSIDRVHLCVRFNWLLEAVADIHVYTDADPYGNGARGRRRRRCASAHRASWMIT